MPDLPAADPSVSPADTPAYKRLAAMLAEGEGLDDAQPMYSPLGELRAFKAEFDALLAVGERDRRQIARLTEALERAKVDLAQTAGNAWEHGPGGRYAIAEAGIERIGAVLADEEDAP